MGIVDIKNLVFEYIRRDETGNVEGIERAVNGVNLDIREGDFVGILGSNGSGKSTLAKHINALLMPTDGAVYVNGLRTDEHDNLLKIRQIAGMVFQNPDNQIISSVVEEDVGFGPENMGVPTEEILKRVKESLEAVGMFELRKHSPNKLSGGQKQRVAIAGIMAMRPRCIILDEPTAMLDPVGRKEVLNTLWELNKKEKITIILITHYMEEVIAANKIFVMDNGKIVLSGSPEEVFSKVSELESYRLEVPDITKLAFLLKNAGIDIKTPILTIEELREAISDVINCR